MAFPELQFCPGCTLLGRADHVEGCRYNPALAISLEEHAAACAAKFEKAQAYVEAALRKEYPAQTIPVSEVVNRYAFDANGEVECPVCGQRGLHACVPPPKPTTLIGSSPDRIVDLVVFKDRLYVATERGVFVKRQNEDAFDEVALWPAPPVDGHAADKAAGLVPLHPNQKSGNPDPFSRGGH